MVGIGGRIVIILGWFGFICVYFFVIRIIGKGIKDNMFIIIVCMGGGDLVLRRGVDGGVAIVYFFGFVVCFCL